ncbi:MAG: hypothetical protein IJF69_00860 [Clostridia bacterium]|nr:hypothetical protein [Clostridia bacterium]
MKKTLSLVMIVAMLLSCVAFAVPASAKATAENIDYVEALYFEKAPTIDGYISEAEWGEATVYVESYDCATVDDKDPYYNFFYNRVSATNRDDYGQFEYYIWLRWDLNRFYLGVKVTDPDVHCLKNGTTNTWNGDAIQTRIDKSGANGAVNGETFTVTADRQKPWSSTTVPDFLFGYVEIAGGFSEAWENTQNKGMTSFSNNPLGTAQCVVAPAGSNYSPDTQAGITTYEVSIPWAYIYNGQYESLEMKKYAAGRDSAKQGPRGAIGKEFGMSLVVLNDGADATAGWDAFMSWGSGICNAQQEEGAKACAGSNSVTLVETPVSQAATYTTYDPTSLLDAKFSAENVDDPNVFYDYLAGDTYKENKVSYDQLSSLTYDDPADLGVWGAPEFGGKIGKAADSAHGNVLDYTYDPTEDTVQTYIDSHDDTIRYLFPASYTFEFDIMYTKTNQAAEGYAPALYNWFGGASSVAYMCGYFFNDSQFKIVNANDPLDVLATYDGFDLKPNTWYNWKFQFDNDSCNARLWIDDLSTEADNAQSGTAGTPGYTGDWGTLIFNSRWRYYYYSNEEALDPDQGVLMIFRQMNTQVAYDNVKIYNFASTAKIKGPDNESKPGKPTGPVTGGGSINTDNVTKVDGVWNVPITVTQQYLSATKLSFTVKVDPAKGTFDGVKGLDEGTYTIDDKGNGEYVITITKFDQIKSLKAGDKLFDILIKSESENFADLNAAITDAYTYSNTGDGMVFIIIAAVIAVLGCAIVIGKRRAMVR